MSADDVAFLTRSPNRGAVLRALAADARDRAELREVVGASRVTVGRITTDLEQRGWVERDGTAYRATKAGRVVAAAYERFLSTVDSTRRLDPVLEFLPVEAFDFDLAALADAEVVAPTPTAPGAHLARLRELFDRTDEVWMVVHAVAPRVVASQYEATRDHGYVTRGVLTPEVSEAIRANDEVCERIRAMLETGTLELAEHESVPFQVAVFDDLATISADDETGVPRGIVVSDDPAVREWVLETFERLRAEATALSPAAFAADSDA